MTKEQLLLKALEIAATVATTVVTAGVSALPVLLPILVPVAKHLLLQNATDRQRRVFDAVELAAKPGVSLAIQRIQAALAKAALPGSPGGTTVTQEEWNAALAEGVMAARGAVNGAQLGAAAVAAYGGEEALAASLAEIIKRDLKDKHGTTPPPAGG